MEFEKTNIAFLVGMIGLVLMGLSLIYTGQDGTLLKICLVLIGIAMGLPLSLPDIFKKTGKE
jgi:uncharacterized membrane protein